MFAHAVLQLADQGWLSLDTSLVHYVPGYFPRDDRAHTITAKHVLAHSAGLPNWRNSDFPLKTYFEPGEQFSYSGEGYLYLQKAIEKITGEKAHALVDELVFRPLGMTRSSLIWDIRFDLNRVYPHDAFGRPALGGKPGEANAAWSLQTTAVDFARILLAVLNGERLTPGSAERWLEPHIDVRHPGIQCLVPSNEGVATGVAWGLGWGLEPDQGTFFHWGDNGPFTALRLAPYGPGLHLSFSTMARLACRSCRKWLPIPCPVTGPPLLGSTIRGMMRLSGGCFVRRSSGA